MLTPFAWRQRSEAFLPRRATTKRWRYAGRGVSLRLARQRGGIAHPVSELRSRVEWPPPGRPPRCDRGSRRSRRDLECSTSGRPCLDLDVVLTREGPGADATGALSPTAFY